MFSAVKVVLPLIAGIGVGGLFFPPLILIQAAMPSKDMATATATHGLLRQLGSTVGIAVGQAIWSTVRSSLFWLIATNSTRFMVNL